MMNYMGYFNMTTCQIRKPTVRRPKWHPLQHRMTPHIESSGVSSVTECATSAVLTIAVQEYALCAIANLATFSTNQKAMFTCEVTRKQLSISADIKRASCVRRQALRTFRLCSENNDIKILMGDLWRKEKESLRWLANG